jgi:iron complex outermembrane receptor protein
MFRSTLLRGVSAGALTFAFCLTSAIAQEALPPIEIGAAQPSDGETASSEAGYAPGFSPARAKLPIYRDPPGQTVTTIDHKFLKPTPMFTVREMLEYSPGVAIQQGNSPRDLNISIRGYGNRLGAGYPYGIRNIKMYEDGFPIVTADGNGNTDMLDPHAFNAVDVYRGPSSALFGNNAYGGAINFRTFTGAEIDGVETGSEFGSFGYINNYVRAGKNFKDGRFGEFDIAFFGSDTRGDNYLPHKAYQYDQGRILATWSPVPTDRFTLKFIANNSLTQNLNRLNQTAYYFNPYQTSYGCAFPTALNAPLCNNLFTPFPVPYLGSPFKNNTLTRQSVYQLGAHVHSLREIAGVRWEHDFDANTVWRTQFTYDYQDFINGTWPPPRIGPSFLGGFGGPVAIRGPSVGINVSTDITNHGSLFGLPATHYLGFFYNNVKTTNPLFTQIPDVWNWGAIGPEVAKIDSYHSNISLRAREEIALTPQLTAAVGFSTNWNRVWGVNTVNNFRKNSVWQIPDQTAIDNDYWNTAPEASLTYRYSPEWQFRARYAAGYGTPTFVYLTTTRDGAGDNSTLKAQTNMGVDVGVDWTPSPDVKVSLTGFNEWFRNEILNLSNGLSLYYASVPASIHRGFEANIDWRPVDGWRFIAAYTYNDQFFTNFWDNLGSISGNFVYYNRAGNKIPNVPPHTLTARVGYDQPDGDFKGLGSYVEYVFKSGYTIDNANFSSLPGYGLVNLNVHYNRDVADFYFKNIELYFNVNNVFNRRYIAGAQVMGNSLISGTPLQQSAYHLMNNNGASILAGQPVSLIGGVKFKF